MTEPDVTAEPVSNITDAWKVWCGCLYLHVKTPDGVTRTTFVPMPQTRARLCPSVHSVPHN